MLLEFARTRRPSPHASIMYPRVRVTSCQQASRSGCCVCVCVYLEVGLCRAERYETTIYFIHFTTRSSSMHSNVTSASEASEASEVAAEPRSPPGSIPRYSEYSGRRARSRVLRVRDVATEGTPVYRVEVPRTATMADAVFAFLSSHGADYPFRYVTGVLADNRLLSSAQQLGMRVDVLRSDVIDVVPFISDVEAVLRRWSDNARMSGARRQMRRRSAPVSFHHGTDRTN